MEKNDLSEYDRLELKQLQEECRNEVDMGILEQLRMSRRQYCINEYNQIDLFHYENPHYLEDRPGRPTAFNAAVFQSVQLNLHDIKIEHQITSVKQDGIQHDPRFKFLPKHLQCTCMKFSPKSGAVLFNQLPRSTRSNMYSCFQSDKQRETPDLIEHRNIIAIIRKDDHNPFFQIASAFNAWIMMRVLDWSYSETQVLLFDAGLTTATEEFHQRVLSDYPLIYGENLLNKYVRFRHLMIAPFETTGPLMSRLNDEQPCRESVLLESFKTHVLERFGLQDDLRSMHPTITIISRRDYEGRNVARKWQNEKEAMEEVQATWPEMIIQSIDFTKIDVKQQIEHMRKSNVVIGMHGAGMVNVLWLPPGALVIEIFPVKKKRWGYRNICYYTNCRYEEYREGEDLTRKQHKTVSIPDWKHFLKNALSKHNIF